MTLVTPITFFTCRFTASLWKFILLGIRQCLLRATKLQTPGAPTRATTSLWPSVYISQPRTNDAPSEKKNIQLFEAWIFSKFAGFFLQKCGLPWTMAHHGLTHGNFRCSQVSVGNLLDEGTPTKLGPQPSAQRYLNGFVIMDTMINFLI